MEADDISSHVIVYLLDSVILGLFGFCASRLLEFKEQETDPERSTIEAISISSSLASFKRSFRVIRLATEHRTD